MYRLPGLSLRAGEVVMELMERGFPGWDLPVGRPKLLSLSRAVRMTLVRLRRNVTFAELGADFGVSAATAWSYYQEVLGVLAAGLAVSAEELAESVAGKICLVDGTLVTVFNWRYRTAGPHRR